MRLGFANGIIPIAKYAGRQPLVSFLEANLDPNEVQIHRSEMAIKAIGPVELVLSTTAVYLLKKFILDPFLDPLAEKWKNAVKRWLSPIQDFHLDIKIVEEDMRIEAYCEADHDIVVDIWRIVAIILNASATDPLISSNSRIRIKSAESGEPKVFCYKENVPVRKIDLQTGTATNIPEDELSLADPPAPTIDDCVRVQNRLAERYREYLDRLQKDGEAKANNDLTIRSNDIEKL